MRQRRPRNWPQRVLRLLQIAHYPWNRSKLVKNQKHFIVFLIAEFKIRFAVSNERVRMLHAGHYDGIISAPEMRRRKRLAAKYLHCLVVSVPAVRRPSVRFQAKSTADQRRTQSTLRHFLSGWIIRPLSSLTNKLYSISAFFCSIQLSLSLSLFLSLSLSLSRFTVFYLKYNKIDYVYTPDGLLASHNSSNKIENKNQCNRKCYAENDKHDRTLFSWLYCNLV